MERQWPIKKKKKMKIVFEYEPTVEKYNSNFDGMQNGMKPMVMKHFCT